MTRSRLLIAAHGGAGARAMTGPQRACLDDALRRGYAVLKHEGTAIQAVEATIRALEASGRFNAGQGSRLQLDGVRRMDASIMEGEGLRAGAVAAIERVRHPITAARFVMQETTHVLLVGPPATCFARHWKLERPTDQARTRRTGSPSSSALDAGASKTLRWYQRMRRRSPALETVGAVALDACGTVAGGASTGGIALMLPGRVGDTPLIGCGVYADNDAGAVSMTGVGEGIIRIAVAKEIVDLMAVGISPATAATRVLRKLVARIAGSAGALVLNRSGRLAILHTTPHMIAGHWNGQAEPFIADRFGSSKRS